MAQQTAIEWLHEIAKQREPDKFDWEQAKQMEKEQIIDAYDIGTTDENIIGKEYYNETYNK
jgi:hypothetical protein